MKARSLYVFVFLAVLVSLLMMAFTPMIAVRAQEGGPVLSEVQLVFAGIVASAALWILRLLTERGYQPNKEVVAIALYVISFVMALIFMSVTFPPFPPFTDAPTFIGALLTYIAQLLEVAAPVVGMAFMVYNWILKRVLNGLANQAVKALSK